MKSQEKIKKAIENLEQLGSMAMEYCEDYDWDENPIGDYKYIDEETLIQLKQPILEILERMTSMKPKGISITHEGRVGNCPHCHRLVREQSDNPKFCLCGQALEWPVAKSEQTKCWIVLEQTGYTDDTTTDVMSVHTTKEQAEKECEYLKKQLQTWKKEYATWKSGHEYNYNLWRQKCREITGTDKYDASFWDTIDYFVTESVIKE